MQRTIVQPADLSGAALLELKQWLGISNSGEDIQLTALLRASLDMCEAFTGQMPLESTCEETLERSRTWAMLQSLPIRAMTSVDRLERDGARAPIASDEYEMDIDAAGVGSIRITGAPDVPRIVVRFVSGIAADWNALPGGLRHGIIRLAAHLHRERDAEEAPGPPASIAALWRPWRRMRLA